MNRKIFSILFLLILAVYFAGCDNLNDSDDTQGEVEFENGLKAADAVIGNLMNSKLMSAVLFMPDMPFNQQGSPIDERKEHYFSSADYSLDKINDSTLTNLIFLIDSLHGTFTYNGETWLHVSEPENMLVFEYPYISITDGQQHSAKIAYYDFNVSNTNVSVNVSIDIDGEKQSEASVIVNGSDFLNPFAESEIINVTVTGWITESSGKNISFNINVTNTEVMIYIEDEGMNDIIVQVTGNNLLSDVSESASSDSQINEVKITFGEIEVIINVRENKDGNAGDVYYQGNKIGELVVRENEQLYIKYNSGNEKSIASIMVNLNSAMLLLSAN